MKRLIFITSIILISLSSCSKKSVRIDIEFVNDKIDTMYIYPIRDFAANLIPSDTIYINSDGTFSKDYTLKNAGLYRIGNRFHFADIVATPGEKVKIQFDLNHPEYGSYYTVSGSTESEKIQEFSTLLKQSQNRLILIDAEFNEMAEKGATEEEMKPTSLKYEAEISTLKTSTISLLKSAGNAHAALYILNTAWNFEFVDLLNEDGEYYDKLITDLRAKMPTYLVLQQIEEQMIGVRNVIVGKQAPDIRLPSPQGDTIKLSSLRGKYVLVDFWASWCVPCREENPKIVKLYEKYNDKGFEIYGVSLDATKDDWVKAINQDNLNWAQVSDLKWWQSAAARQYGINAIPATVIIDKEGKIIARDLRGDKLEQFIANLFN